MVWNSPNKQMHVLWIPIWMMALLQFLVLPSSAVAAAAAAAAGGGTTVTPSVHTRTEWEQVLLPARGGCEQSDNLWDAVTCILQNSPPSCFTVDTPQELYTCFRDAMEEQPEQQEPSASSSSNNNNILRDIWDTALGCFDPYYQCLTDQINNAIAALPPCVSDSATSMAQCFLNNIGECLTSCATESIVGSSPYADNPFNIFDLFSCPGIEDAVLQPVCNIVDCCPPCVTPLEELAECIVNDVLDFGFWDLNCDFTCMNTPDNRRLRHNRLTREITGTTTTTAQMMTMDTEQFRDASQVYKHCLALTPGLFGNHRNNDAREELVTHSNFFDCLVQESLQLFQDATVTTSTTTTTTTSTTPAATTITTESTSSSDASTTTSMNEQDQQQLLETDPDSSRGGSSSSTTTGISFVGLLLLLLFPVL
jgi:hypothetical protein